MLYSRAQLRLLLVLAALLLLGLGVREWRAGFPDAALRLERFDREESLPSLSPSDRGEKTLASPVASVKDTRASDPMPTGASASDDRPSRVAPRAASASVNRPSDSTPPAASPTGERPSRASSRREPPEIPAPVADPRPLDLNRATVAELARLPGVGPSLARRILEERERRGRFDSLEALRQVMGVGPKKLAALRDLVTVGE